MDNIFGILVLAGFFLLFAGIVYFMVSSSRKEAAEKRQAAQALGFTPIEPDAALTEKVTELYRGGGKRPKRIQLRSVSRKEILDGECYLLDIVDHSGDDTSYPEVQASVIFSPALRLPRFGMYPKLDSNITGAALTNRALQWVMAKLAPILDFPDCPEFNQRYMVATHEADAVRKFFTPELQKYLSGTRYATIYAAQDGFLFSASDPQKQKPGNERTGQQVQQALDVFDAFTRFGANG